MMVQTAMIPPRWLIGLSMAVLLAHLWLLENAPLQMGASESMGKRVFTTRVLQIQAAPEPPQAFAPAPPPVPTRPTARAASPVAAVPPPAAPATVVKPMEQPAPEPVPQVRPPELAASVAQAVPEATLPPVAAPAPVVATPPLPKDSMQVARNYAVPGSVRIKFNATGQRGRLEYEALGELLWLHDGKDYEARLGLAAGFSSATMVSTGHITADGLAPNRFSNKISSERAAHFDRDKARVTFSANKPDATLLPGAQDQLSVFMQLASMIAGEPAKYLPGTNIQVQTVDAESADLWVFVVEANETLSLPGGQQLTRKLVRAPRKEFDQKMEIWLAPGLSWLPARIRITQPNGNFIDQQWRSTSSP